MILLRKVSESCSHRMNLVCCRRVSHRKVNTNRDQKLTARFLEELSLFIQASLWSLPVSKAMIKKLKKNWRTKISRRNSPYHFFTHQASTTQLASRWMQGLIWGVWQALQAWKPGLKTSKQLLPHVAMPYKVSCSVECQAKASNLKEE